MSIFFKTRLNSEEYEKLLKRVIEVTAECSGLKAEIELINTKLASLRSSFNRKYPKSEDFEANLNSDGLPRLGKI